ncbi:MAG: OsmC family protein [Promethearchaeota archaeon]
MRISIHLSENLHFVAKTRHFDTIHIDEPESFHGTDLGPSSVEYILIGIGGCLGSTLSFCLKKKKIEIKDLEIIIGGTLKHEGPNKRLRIVRVNAEIFLATENSDSDEQVGFCINNFLEHCVVSNSIIPGFPIDVKVIQKK